MSVKAKLKELVRQHLIEKTDLYYDVVADLSNHRVSSDELLDELAKRIMFTSDEFSELKDTYDIADDTIY